MTNEATKQAMVIDLDGGSNTRIVEAREPVAQNVVNADASDLDQLPECAVVNGDGSVTLPLFEEIELNVKKDGQISTERYSSLTFHRLNGAAMRAIGSTSDDRKAAVTFARSCRIADVVMFKIFDEMDMADIANAGRIINYFLTSGRKTPR